MIILTFDEYDKLLEAAENTEIPENYVFPAIDEILQMVNDENNLSDILTALEKSDNKDYKKAVNKILTDNLYLTDKTAKISSNNLEKTKKMKFTMEEIQQMVNAVKNMEFQCSYYYPSVMDLKELDFKPSLLDVYFLLWLVNTEMDLTDDEKVARKYAQSILQKLMTLNK